MWFKLNDLVPKVHVEKTYPQEAENIEQFDFLLDKFMQDKSEDSYEDVLEFWRAVGRWHMLKKLIQDIDRRFSYEKDSDLLNLKADLLRSEYEHENSRRLDVWEVRYFWKMAQYQFSEVARWRYIMTIRWHDWRIMDGLEIIRERWHISIIDSKRSEVARISVKTLPLSFKIGNISFSLTSGHR